MTKIFHAMDNFEDLFKIRSDEKCDKCKKHKATEHWVGEGGALAFTHGAYQLWCKCCVLKEQIKYAEEAAKRLKKMKKEYGKTLGNCK